MDSSSSPLLFCHSLCFSETLRLQQTMAGCFPLAVGSKANKSEHWKAGRAVGRTCACASAYGRRDAPSLVGLDLSVSRFVCVLCCRLRARVIFTRDVEATILFLTPK